MPLAAIGIRLLRITLIALKYDQEDDELYANLGEAYEKKGLYQEALKAYTNAYELNPESAKATRRIPKLKILLLQKKARNKPRRVINHEAN